MENNNNNLFAPPQAQVADVGQVYPADGAKPIYFPVSQIKLLVMLFATFGLYSVYWFYKNWKLERERTQESMLPVARAIFSVFFVYSLFKRVRDYSQHHEPDEPVDTPLAAGFLATIYIVLSVLSRLPDPYWLITFGSFVPILVAQSVVNAINTRFAPGHFKNDTFSAWNWVAIVAGTIFWVLVFIGLLVGDGS